MSVLPALIGVGILCTWTFWLEGSVAAIRCGVKALGPSAWVAWGLLAWAGHALNHRRGRVVMVAMVAFALWAAVSTPFLPQRWIATIEPSLQGDKSPAFETWPTEESFDAIVVLGGATETITPDFIEVQCDGERIVSAAQMWHAGRCRQVIVTGSSTTNAAMGRVDHPRDEARAMLVSLGVPDDEIQDIEGVNTRSEMQSLATLIRGNETREASISLDRDSRIGVITSAFHMPRAMRLAALNDLDLVPLPCAFRQRVRVRPWMPIDFIPEASHLETTQLVLKETLARWAGQ